MEHTLNNGKTVQIRLPGTEDAQAIITLIATADGETPFLGRNAGEFHPSLEKERALITAMLESEDEKWFVVECDGKLVGQCAVGRVRRSQRFRHRAEVHFVVLAAYCGMGIGRLMMTQCLSWCRDHQITQAELDVVAGNERALHLYESFGFEISGIFPRAMRYPDGSYADEYRMVKFL